MAGTIVADTLQDGAGNSTAMDNAIYGSAKAWVNYNGTGTPAINGSYNVSSVTRSGTGIYIVNFTNAMSDAKYAVAITGGCYLSVLGGFLGEYTTSSTTPNQRSTTSVGMFFQSGTSGAGQDNCTASLVVYR